MSQHREFGRFQPELEQLEDRVVPATTYLIMDFTPDSHAGGLADTMHQVRTTPGGQYAPKFFDYNNDGKVNSTDVQQMSNAIAYKVQQYFSSFLSQDVRVYYGDYNSQTNWGKQWINYGKQYSNVQVGVMYLGGTSSSGAGVIGRAPVASNGYNVEGYGETYTKTIAQWMVNNTPRATVTDFVNRVAQTAAHEFGHMFGLQHTNGYSANNIMSPSQPSNPGAAQFVNANLYMQNGTYQNAFSELRNSFAGQRTQYYTGNLGGQAELAEGSHEEDHDHGEGLSEGGSGAAYDPLAGIHPDLVPVEGFDALVRATQGANSAFSTQAVGSLLDSPSDLSILSASRLQERTVDALFAEFGRSDADVLDARSRRADDSADSATEQKDAADLSFTETHDRQDTESTGALDVSQWLRVSL